ncbi:PAS domain-containing protein [Vogesella perlucida]|nr:PAS domain-containing protein [Vogesella perlucida]
MADFSTVLQAFKSALCKEVDVGGLFARSATAYKWKAPWRALLLRETVAWRLQDLLEQSLELSRVGHVLGARILLRSAFETLAMLIYLNRSMRSVVAGTLDFHVFSDKTSRLLLGSRDKTTSTESISILTVLDGANKRYPGLSDWYAALSESAHPNYEGMLVAYSSADTQNHVTRFRNRWSEMYGKSHESALNACFEVFLHEYDDESSSALEALEAWVEQNDAKLEATKPSAK